MKALSLIGFLTCAIFALTLQSCSVYEHFTKNRVNGTSITASMSDQDIVKAFGLDPATASVKKINGKDGTTTTFSSGEQQVSITRSAVTGVAVMATGPINGTWALGSP